MARCSNVEFDRQRFGKSRFHGLEAEIPRRRRILDRIPQDGSAGREAPMDGSQSLLHALEFTGLFKRRIYKNETAPLLGR